MKVGIINKSPIHPNDIELYKERVSKLKGGVFNGNDVGIYKRIISVRLLNNEDLILVNPIITSHSASSTMYYEKDTLKPNKVRKTVRFKSIIVETDNLGIVEFKPTNENEKWETANDFFEDGGLLECVLVQRAIDAINGVDITDISRLYSETIISQQKPGRNERVMLSSPEGETVFIKYKNADEYIKRGYQLI
jgi:peptide deformylase